MTPATSIRPIATVEYSKARRPAVPLRSPQSLPTVEILLSFNEIQVLTTAFPLATTKASIGSSPARRWHLAHCLLLVILSPLIHKSLVELAALLDQSFPNICGPRYYSDFPSQLL